MTTISWLAAGRWLFLGATLATIMFVIATYNVQSEPQLQRTPEIEAVVSYPHNDDHKELKMKPDTAFVVRTYKPDSLKVERLNNWKFSFSSNVDLHLLISETDVSHPIDSPQFAQWFNDTITIYDIPTLNRTFPTMHECGFFAPSSNKQFYIWLMQQLALQYWWLQVGGLNSGYKHIWIIEDDTEFSGKMMDLLTYYNDSRPSDILVPDFRHIENDGWWMWTHNVTHKWEEEIPLLRRYFSMDHVQRWSAKYLDYSTQESIHGMIATSEQAAVTLAVHRGFSISKIEKKHISPWLDAFVSMTLEQFNERAKEFPNQLFHAVKV